jgi:hypothetical protein
VLLRREKDDVLQALQTTDTKATTTGTLKRYEASIRGSNTYLGPICPSCFAASKNFLVRRRAKDANYRCDKSEARKDAGAKRKRD